MFFTGHNLFWDFEASQWCGKVGADSYQHFSELVSKPWYDRQVAVSDELAACSPSGLSTVSIKQKQLMEVMPVDGFIHVSA